MNKLNPTKIFKEKKTVKEELLKALENGIKLNHSSLAKNVGISVHRVKKYCKNHNIDLDNYNAEIVQEKKRKKEFDEINIKAKKKKVQIEPISNKFHIGTPKDIKALLKDKKND